MTVNVTSWASMLMQLEEKRVPQQVSATVVQERP